MTSLPRGRRLPMLALVVLWLGYSAAVLGWHAWSSPPADVCITR